MVMITGDADGDDADNRHLQHNQHQPVGIEQERLVANIPAGDFKGQGNHQHHHKDAGIFRHFMPQISEEEEPSLAGAAVNFILLILCASMGCQRQNGFWSASSFSGCR